MPTRQLSLLGVMFGLIFFTLVTSAFFPFRPIDPLWTLRITDTALRSSWLALISVALIELGAYLDPDDSVLERRQALFSRLSLAACLIFLLIIPVQLFSGMSKVSSLRNTDYSRIQQNERKLKSLQQAVATSKSVFEMQQRFKQLQGPSIASISPELPLYQVKVQVEKALNQVKFQIEREKNVVKGVSTVGLVLTSSLRDIVTCILLSLSFSIFARFPESDRTLIEELSLHFRRRPETPKPD